MSALTLADFLLPRIAEDEEVAKWDHGNDPGFIHEPKNRRKYARVLAECDAKRRIVAYHAAGMAYVESGADDPVSHAQYRAGLVTIRLLALPYADHPDYDEAWTIGT